MDKQVYSVGQINRYIKGLFEQDVLLSRVSVRGEVSNCKYHSSGHVYFSLKDETGTLSCILFAGHRRGLTFPMKDGDKVVVHGNVDIYERDGRYQLYARQIEAEGEGVLYARFLQLKKELEESGMFDPMYKKDIPKYAMKIGVVTASTGAAIRDIENVARRRNPYVQLVLYPAQVQGEGAAESIARGIACLDRLGVDVMIVGRGGGSLEDLWAFNEETVARAIFESDTPIVSAVGHETDTTIADFVADLRAPTPSAAAELTVFALDEMLADMESIKRTMHAHLLNKVAAGRTKAELFLARMRAMRPDIRLQEKRHRLIEQETALMQAIRERFADRRAAWDVYTERLHASLPERMKTHRQRYLLLLTLLKGLNPLSRLERGYAYVTTDAGEAVRETGQVQAGEALLVYVTDGKIKTQVTEVLPDE